MDSDFSIGLGFDDSEYAEHLESYKEANSPAD